MRNDFFGEMAETGGVPLNASPVRRWAGARRHRPFAFSISMGIKNVLDDLLSSNYSGSISGHRPSALGLLLQRRRAREVLRSVHVHEPSSLLTFDLMDISMWVSMDISMWVSIEMSIEISIGCPWTPTWRCPSERTGSRGGGLGSADALLG